ncbi:MAG: hypothetical protein NZV14_00475 [Bryobacteraceae bacterium]|nr:hypothetical protein [Bryobacteraceae bacterium]MDW8376607.1 4Fe-4S dicluster domain-containing protein [Bryobacterales bacterium]
MNDPNRENIQEKATPRRLFLQALAAVGSGAALATGGMELLDGTSAQAAEIPPPLTEPVGNLLVRMQRELEQSLSTGRPQWLMVVDTRKCIGCDACTIACKAENPTGPGVGFRRVIKRELPVGPRPWVIFKPINCLQCDDAPCAKAVPQGMIRKRPDGIVEFDSDRLRGAYAQAAMRACPLNQIHVDDGKTYTYDTPQPQEYEERLFFENGKWQTRKPRASQLPDSARKCNFCSHLVEAGALPACVSTCIGGVMYFGDANLRGSLVNEVTQGRRIFKHHNDMGLKPRVIYFEESMPDTPHLDCNACHY